MAHPALEYHHPRLQRKCLRIEATLERVMTCVGEQNWDAEVLVIDDGSTRRYLVAIVERWMRVASAASPGEESW